MWKLIIQTNLENNWLSTIPVESNIFRIKHFVSETDDRRLKLAQRYKKGFITFGYIENGRTITLANPKQDFVYGREIELFIFTFPTGISEPRLFVKKIDSSVSNAWIIQISEFMDVTVTISEVEGLQAALDGKSPAEHNHAISLITGLEAELTSKAIASEVTDALDGKSPVVHEHQIADVTGLQTALDEKAIASDVQTALEGKSPTVHNHGIADVTGLQTQLDAKAIASEVQTALAGKAPTVHGHQIADTSGLQTALDAKAATSYVITALAGKAPIAHGHTSADIGGLTAFVQSLQPASNIIVSTTVPANPFPCLIWHEMNTAGILIESWNYLNNRWQSITKYRSDYYSPTSGISGNTSYALPFDDRYDYLFVDFAWNCIYNVGTVDAANCWRAIITTQPTGNTFANSGVILNDSLSKRISVNTIFVPAIGERLLLMYQKFGTAPNAKIGTSFTYHLLRK